MKMLERAAGVEGPDLPTQSRPWLTCILTLKDGTDVAPVLFLHGGDPTLPPPVKASEAVVSEDILERVIKEKGSVQKFRFEYLSWEEIVSRGYRQNPPL